MKALCALLLVVKTTANFDSFCKESVLDSTLDGDPERRFIAASGNNKATCVQIFSDKIGLDADYFCASKAPYPIKKSEKISSDQIKCTWEEGDCSSGDYIQGKCYSVLGECEGNWEPAKIYSEDQVKWLSLFNSDEAVRIQNWHGRTLDESNVYHNGMKYPATKNISEEQKVLILQRNSALQLNIGDYLTIKGISNTPWLCSTKAKGERGQVQIGTGIGSSGTITAPGKYETINGKDFTLFMTANRYTPKLTASSEIDLTYFHEVCKKLCDSATNCFGASYQHFVDPVVASKLPNGRYYYPGARYKVKPTEDCSKDAKDNKFAILFNVLAHLKISPAAMPPNHWRKNKPNKLCSDQGRYATVFRKTKSESGVENVPVFDRLPIVCVFGSLPAPILSAGSCTKNAQFVNGKCKCKAGFTDVLTLAKTDNNILKLIKDTGIGEQGIVVCLGPPDCTRVEHTEETVFESIMFLIDGSASVDTSWSSIENFIRNAGKWLPRPSRIWFMQYGGPGQHSDIGKTNRKWSDADYAQAAQTAVETYLYGTTATYTNWLEFLDQRKAHDGRYITSPESLIIVITDGATYGDQVLIPSVKQEMKNHNMKVKIVAVGVSANIFADDIDDPKDVIQLNNYNELEASMKKVVSELVCKDYVAGDLEDALAPEKL